jgi:two-component system C4-dicarboxylate transport sensor histidine kinase DctB
MRQFGRKPMDEAEAVDLGAAVQSATEFYAETARLRGVELIVNIEPGLQVRGRKGLVEQVVANLLSNAMAVLKERASDRGLVVVKVRRHEANVFVEVRDNAGGVPPGVLPHIFEPFFTTKAGSEGTGLGLSISYGIVSEMNGTITAHNDEAGAVFTIELPSVCAT